eukprot:4873775-Pyramimonas_sp.AAC.2
MGLARGRKPTDPHLTARLKERAAPGWFDWPVQTRKWFSLVSRDCHLACLAAVHSCTITCRVDGRGVNGT